uniref:cyclic GMP-AMP synthase DncV-like nucleotidyltransferase n=1 Tax=Enterobacter cloacae complex sp. 280C5 TaxID=3395861 RepID=UPI003CF1AF2D
MPMTVFESEPSIGHTLLLLLVDTSLKSLEAENDGWVYEEKNTCGRIKIPHEKTHIDVPRYCDPQRAISDQTNCSRFSTHHRKSADSMFESLSANMDMREAYLVEPDKVNLALRQGARKVVESATPKLLKIGLMIVASVLAVISVRFAAL